MCQCYPKGSFSTAIMAQSSTFFLTKGHLTEWRNKITMKRMFRTTPFHLFRAVRLYTWTESLELIFYSLIKCFHKRFFILETCGEEKAIFSYCSRAKRAVAETFKLNNKLLKVLSSINGHIIYSCHMLYIQSVTKPVDEASLMEVFVTETSKA